MNAEKLKQIQDQEQPENDIYERFSDAEDLDDYQMDGYHPVTLGETFNQGKYQIIQKLGWGHFSTVWLVQDKQNNKFYALKIQKSKESYQESAQDELMLLNELKKHKNNEKWQKIIDQFNEHGEKSKLIEVPQKENEKSKNKKENNKKLKKKYVKDADEVQEEEDDDDDDNISEKDQNKSESEKEDKKENEEEKKENSTQELEGVYEARKQFKISTKENFTINLHDNFTHFGMHGKHYCSTFELVGPTLLDLITHFDDKEKLMDLWLVKLITRQILVGMVYMHEVCDIIHTDIKPENIMIQFNESNLDLFVDKLRSYDKLPLSMKFLQVLRESNSGKNKKKYDKKKKKKAEAKQKLIEEEEQKNQEDDVDGENESQTKDTNTETEKQIDQQKQDETQQNGDEKRELKKEKEIETQNSNNIKNKEQNTESDNKQVEKKKENANEEEDGEWDDVSSIEDDYTLLWKNDIIIPLDQNLKIKIVDFGNACLHSNHFTDRIQTREYRSPEAIIRADYEHNTDVWSLACMVFELITNNFLFKPKPGKNYKKNDHHLCMIIETLGKFPKNFALSGQKSRKFFNKGGSLVKISDVEDNSDPIAKILHGEFDIDLDEACDIEDFLTPMLQIDPKKRVSARQALEHPWLWN